VITLLILSLVPAWLYLLHRWHHWYLPYLILAAVGVLERPEPQPVTHRLVCADLTVADGRWGRANWPAARYELVLR
jgi:hypothetical protein